MSETKCRFGRNVRTLATGLLPIDDLLPAKAFALGAVHEVLSGTPLPSLVLPLLLTRAASEVGRVVWCDSSSRFNPPAVQAMGMPLHRLTVLRPHNPGDEMWAVAECLRCSGVAVCVASVERLSRIHARKLQLAAERGGGIGILLRPARAVSWPYAAATRWMVKPASGGRTVQRWSVELIHGHGGRVGQSVLLEWCRETHHVRAIEVLADRPGQTEVAVASA